VETVSAEIVVIERLDSHARVQSRDRIALSDGRRTFTIGRSIRADVTLDDPHAAVMHACVEITPDGRILASDLGSVNGLVVGGKRLRNASGLALADGTLQVGRTRLRVRTEQECLEPEKPDQLRPLSLLDGPAWIAGTGALVAGLQLAYGSWLGAPRDLAAGIVTSLAGAASIAAMWVMFWGLLSRVMLGEWRWLRHTAIFLGVGTTFAAVIGIVDLSMFSFAHSSWNNRNLWIGAVALGCALYLQLTHASSLARRHAALVACVIPVVLAAGSQWLLERQHLRDVNYIPARVRIYPSSLRLRQPDTPETYFKSTTALRELADKRLAEALANDPGSDDM
jgi:FHA domain-containing protein